MNGNAEPNDAEEIALFPLGLVLFPGGRLPLRIFEARYVDMVGDCMREQRPFGVVPISEGRDTGPVPSFHGSGTLAVIDNFDQGADGLLLISAHGTERFELESHRVREDGLVLGRLGTVPEMPAAVDPGCAHVPQLLAEVYASRPELAAPEPWHMDDAGWVAYRVAELLPIDIPAKLEILGLASGAEKLRRVAGYLEAPGEGTPAEDSGPRH
ncbi:MAG: LON peptidase substrate-binding domain-containing protein [Gammaproteobacteria bacterium]